VVRCSANGESVARAGNREEGAAPHGVYPCTGDDAWIAITVASDDEWQALVAAMGAPAWAREPRFATAAGRVAHQDDLDAQLAAWTRESGAYLLMAQLQEAGVPPASCSIWTSCCRIRSSRTGVTSCRSITRCSACCLRALGFSGSRRAPAVSTTRARCSARTNDTVLGEILGLSAAEIEQLLVDDVIA